MTNVSSIITQLKRERDRVETQLKGLDAALRAFARVYGGLMGSDKSAQQAGRGSCTLSQLKRGIFGTWLDRALR